MAFLPADEKPFSQEEDFSPPSLSLTPAAHKLMDGWPDGKLHGPIETASSAVLVDGKLSICGKISVGQFFLNIHLSSHATRRVINWVVYVLALSFVVTGYLTRRRRYCSRSFLWLGDTIVPVA